MKLQVVKQMAEGWESSWQVRAWATDAIHPLISNPKEKGFCERVCELIKICWVDNNRQDEENRAVHKVRWPQSSRGTDDPLTAVCAAGGPGSWRERGSKGESDRDGQYTHLMFHTESPPADTHQLKVEKYSQDLLDKLGNKLEESQCKIPTKRPSSRF